MNFKVFKYLYLSGEIALLHIKCFKVLDILHGRYYIYKKKRVPVTRKAVIYITLKFFFLQYFLSYFLGVRILFLPLMFVGIYMIWRFQNVCVMSLERLFSFFRRINQIIFFPPINHPGLNGSRVKGISYLQVSRVMLDQWKTLRNSFSSFFFLLSKNFLIYFKAMNLHI